MEHEIETGVVGVYRDDHQHSDLFEVEVKE